jgi:hypothetical protein
MSNSSKRNYLRFAGDYRLVKPGDAGGRESDFGFVGQRILGVGHGRKEPADAVSVSMDSRHIRSYDRPPSR